MDSVSITNVSRINQAPKQITSIFVIKVCGGNFVIQAIANTNAEAFTWIAAAVVVVSLAAMALRKISRNTLARDDLVVLQKSLLSSFLCCGLFVFPSFFLAAYTRSCIFLRIAYFMGWLDISLTKLAWASIVLNLWYRIKHAIEYFKGSREKRYRIVILVTCFLWISAALLSAIQTIVLTPRFMKFLYIALYIVGSYMCISVYRSSKRMVSNVGKEKETSSKTFRQARAFVVMFLITDLCTFLPSTVAVLLNNLYQHRILFEVIYRMLNNLLFLHHVPVMAWYVLSGRKARANEGTSWSGRRFCFKKRGSDGKRDGLELRSAACISRAPNSGNQDSVPSQEIPLTTTL